MEGGLGEVELEGVVVVVEVLAHDVLQLLTLCHGVQCTYLTRGPLTTRTWVLNNLGAMWIWYRAYNGYETRGPAD